LKEKLSLIDYLNVTSSPEIGQAIFSSVPVKDQKVFFPPSLAIIMAFGRESELALIIKLDWLLEGRSVDL